LANKTFTESNEFVVNKNLIHYSFTKSKRVTQSVLASEIYGIIKGVNIAIAINITLFIINEQLNLLKVFIVVCTDSYSLYKCLVKLSTTKKKRLIINIMALR
jgi:hypothetical protein